MGNMWTTFWIELPSILHRQWLQVALHASAIGPQLGDSLDILLDIGGEILQINANHTEIIPQIRVFTGIRTGSFSLGIQSFPHQDCPQDMSAEKNHRQRRVVK